jgi:hypothetical protein
MPHGLNPVSPYQCLITVLLIAAVGALVASLEMLSLSSQYRDGGMFSWRLHRLIRPGVAKSRLLPLYDQLFSYPSILYLTLLRAACLVGIFIEYRDQRYLWPLVLIVASVSVLYTLRGPDGRSGADQMTKVIYVSAALALLSPHQWVWEVELFFLAGQLVLSYLTSGILKIREPVWREGKALSLIFRQQSYGNRMCWQIVNEHPQLSRVLTWSVMLFECGFPIILLLPLRFGIAILAFGLVFHFANAAILGLNTFLWSYLALYPAMIWCILNLHKLLLRVL